MSNSVYAAAARCIFAVEPDEKCALTKKVSEQIQTQQLSYTESTSAATIEVPGRPLKPVLVPPRMLAQRKLGSDSGRAAFIHAIAHIEFNAINLAWDAVYRFRGMPGQYYLDWAKVAREEAYHFSLLNQRLQEMGYAYGDFDAHDGLWEMACKTDHDVLVRMALVPRVLEARGLDVTPGMIQRLIKVGDLQSVEILQVIFRDEIGHVEIGSHWFNFLCDARGLNPAVTFKQLLEEYMKGQIRGPFEHAARMKAGFSEIELSTLENMSGENQFDR